MENVTLVAVRRAKLAPLVVADWFAADRVSDAELRKHIAEGGADSVSVAGFPLWPYRTPPPPLFAAVGTREGHVAVVRVTQRHVHPNDPKDGW